MRKEYKALCFSVVHDYLKASAFQRVTLRNIILLQTTDVFPYLICLKKKTNSWYIYLNFVAKTQEVFFLVLVVVLVLYETCWTLRLIYKPTSVFNPEIFIFMIQQFFHGNVLQTQNCSISLFIIYYVTQHTYWIEVNVASLMKQD